MTWKLLWFLVMNVITVMDMWNKISKIIHGSYQSIYIIIKNEIITCYKGVNNTTCKMCYDLTFCNRAPIFRSDAGICWKSSITSNCRKFYENNQEIQKNNPKIYQTIRIWTSNYRLFSSRLRGKFEECRASRRGGSVRVEG